MALPTFAELPLRSPIAVEQQSPNRAFEAEVMLADLTGVGLQQVRGSEAALRALVGSLPNQIGGVLASKDRLVTRLTDDEWLMISPDRAGEPDLADASALITANDVSHGYGTLLLAGRRAPQVLPKLCGLDFDDSTFRDLHAAQTSLAKVRALVLRRDHHGRPGYLIAVGRSVTEYVWDQLLDAAGEFQLSVIDSAALARTLIAGVPG